MPTVLERAIQNLEGRASAAHAKATFHRDRIAHHRREADGLEAQATHYEIAIAAIREIAPEIEDASPEEAPADAARPFPNNGRLPNGSQMFDRDVIRRELAVRNIHYPLAPGHRAVGQFVRQSIIMACRKHPAYDTYVSNGGYDLTANDQKQALHLQHAVDSLGIDTQKVADDATVLHELIYTLGEPGKDYRV